VPSDAAVIRPVLSSIKGLAFAQALLPAYSAIDACHMTSCTIDEALRRLISVGATPDHIGGVDNFCWPSIQYHPEKNPDGKHKAAQLVRSCRSLREICLAYEIPLLSGKDSMYADGHLTGRYGEQHKLSALETLQFSTIGVIEDVTRCVSMDSKAAGDLIYLLGVTCNELGGSEFYEHLGYTGLNVPQVRPRRFLELYRALYRAIDQGLVASAHGIYRGGLGVHLALVAMGGNLGMHIDLRQVPTDGLRRNDRILFSESAGRFIVTIAPENKALFEETFRALPCAGIGRVNAETVLEIVGLGGEQALLAVSVQELKAAWKRPFGDLI
jgi:phosphoribosylformylglycinamidine synthase